MTSSHTNIKKLYALNFLCGLVLWYPIEKLFLQDIGVTALGISLNAIIFLAILIIFDIPSGVLADRWKRTYTLLLAMLALAAGSFLGGLSSSLPVYLCATALVGGFVVLTSGTFQAMMYDSLKMTGHQDQYDKHQGRAYALFLTGLGLSSIAGGYLADLASYQATYFATAALMLLAAGITLLLHEPPAYRLVADKQLKAHVTFSLRQIKTSQLLMQLTLLITAANILRGTQNEYAGLYFIALGLTAIPIGYATAAKWLASSLGQVLAPKLGRRVLRFTPLFFITFSLFGLIQSRWSLVFFFMAAFLYAVISNQAEAAVQDYTPSEIRATTLSVISFASNVLLIPVGLLFGWITQHSSVFMAYAMVGILGLAYIVSWTVTEHRALKNISRSAAKSPPSYEDELS